MQLHVTDRDAFRPVRTGLAVLKALHDQHPKDFAFLCFPEKGKYAARAYGVKGKKDAVVGAVEVE